MRKLLTKLYGLTDSEFDDWNFMQKMFGRHYLGIIILLVIIALFVY